MKLHTLFSKRL